MTWIASLHGKELCNTDTRHGLQCTWGLGNQIFVFPGKKASLAGDVGGGSSGTPAVVHEVKWDTGMHSPITRKLANEGHNIFVTLQAGATEASGSSLKPLLIKASKQYRSILKASSLELSRLTTKKKADALKHPATGGGRRPAEPSAAEEWILQDMDGRPAIEGLHGVDTVPIQVDQDGIIHFVAEDEPTLPPSLIEKCLQLSQDSETMESNMLDVHVASCSTVGPTPSAKRNADSPAAAPAAPAPPAPPAKKRKLTPVSNVDLNPYWKKYLVSMTRYYDVKTKLVEKQLEKLDVHDEVENRQLQESQKVVDMTELIWNLCEILWIDVSPGGVVIMKLLEWLRWHFTDGERLVAEIQQEEVPDHHPEYWDCIYRLVLQGQIDKVRAILSHSSCASMEAFQHMDDVLRKMPILNQLSRGQSVSEFDMKWRHWRDDCERRIEEGEFSTSVNLQKIARMLCGEEAVFMEVKDLCETWYHMLVSKMLYQRPTVKSVDLNYYIQSCVDAYRSDGKHGELDGILMSALEFDIHQVIRDSCGVLRSWWFAAHITDLLHHCGQLESHRLEFGSNLREYLILEYATSLMSHKSLWQLGVDYFDQCSEFGRKYLEHYIDHIPIDTEHKANKVLSVCEKRNMTEQIKSICKVMGMRCIQHNRLGSALSWFLRSKDVAFATLIAEKFLSEYNEYGAFSNLDLIDNLGSSMLLSNRLTFLGKYREYHKLYENSDLHAAGSLLLSLLTSRLAPREFWITLLKDTITLLEARKLIFGSKETFELMHCLEELTKDRLYLTSDIKDDLSDLKETIDLLNLALTRNLARSIIIEGTVKA